MGDGKAEGSSAIGEKGQLHSCLMLTERSFTSLKVCNLKIRM